MNQTVDSITQSREVGTLCFRCNVCGAFCQARVTELEREKVSCNQCGSIVRWRSIIHLLSLGLFGQSLVLTEFPQRPDIRGIGISDWDGYATRLADKCNYQNTQFHTEPRLDIAAIDPALEGQFDFIISSEVFEHVPPPVSRAFENSYRLLKPGGLIVFTVPYITTGQTKEHFPDLYDFQLVERDGQHILKNITQAGAVQVFEDLVFHGGSGATLEMRLFSESSLIEEFQKAGFQDVRIHKEHCFDYGIYLIDNCSLPISARKY